MYMFASTIALSKGSVMNIVGISSSEDSGNKFANMIMTEYRHGDIDSFVETLKNIKPNVYLNEVPYRIAGMTEVREERFKKDLKEFFDAGGKFNVGTNSVLPINCSV